MIDYDDKSKGWLARYIGRKVHEARGWTMETVASRAGSISKALLGQLEKDGQNVSLERLEGVLMALDLRLSIEQPAPLLAAEPAPPLMADFRRRLSEIVTRLPDEEVEILALQLSLWEKRYK